MSVPTVAFFNNKGGVGKTSLVYHLAWMYADSGKRVVAVDLDPQANLTSSFVSTHLLEEIWKEGSPFSTIYRCIEPLVNDTGDVEDATPEYIDENIRLIVGDLALSNIEDQLSEAWRDCLDGNERAYRLTSAFWRIMQEYAKYCRADLIMIDLGPNLGAINRAALIAADFVVLPLSPDIYSYQALRHLGSKLRSWRDGWAKRIARNPEPHKLPLPRGRFQPLGYVVMPHSVRFDRPVKSYERWIERIPAAFRTAVLGEKSDTRNSTKQDPCCLAMLKHYRSLMPMAQESRKPMFHLRSADGAIGSHQKAALDTAKDFRKLADKIEEKMQESVTKVAL